MLYVAVTTRMSHRCTTGRRGTPLRRHDMEAVRTRSSLDLGDPAAMRGSLRPFMCWQVVAAGPCSSRAGGLAKAGACLMLAEELNRTPSSGRHLQRTPAATSGRPPGPVPCLSAASIVRIPRSLLAQYVNVIPESMPALPHATAGHPSPVDDSGVSGLQKKAIVLKASTECLAAQAFAKACACTCRRDSGPPSRA